MSAPTRRPAPPPSRPAAPSAALTPPVTLDLSPRKAKPICPRIIFTAVEGFGKTTLGAYAPNPVILMAREETGYDTLLSAGRVPAVPAIAIADWPALIATLDALIADSKDREWVILDALGGFERLCHEFVCKRDFANDWGEKGFTSYNKGYDISVSEWLKMLQRLDQLNSRGIGILILGHSKIRPFKNPTGADFDRYVCDCHDKTWGASAKWADAVLFGNFFTVIDKEKKGKGKGIGGTDRVLYTERRDAWDAKNRYGMDPEIGLAAEPEAMWDTVWNQINKEKQS